MLLEDHHDQNFHKIVINAVLKKYLSSKIENLNHFGFIADCHHHKALKFIFQSSRQQYSDVICGILDISLNLYVSY